MDLPKSSKEQSNSGQAGAELCQAQAKLEALVEVGVEFGVEVDACH